MTQQCFSSTANMSYLHLHSVETSTNGMSRIISLHLALSVSSPERYTQLLEEFIFTCLSTLGESFEADPLGSSMWTVGIRTWCLLGELQRKGTTTRLKMETLSRGASRDLNHAEECMLDLIDSSISRTCASLRRNFLSYTTKWIEELSCRLSPVEGLTPNGDTLLNRSLTGSLPAMPDSTTLAASLMDEMIGWRSLEYDLETWN